MASLPPIPGEVPITSGTASDRQTWFLYVGGPSHDLCLGFGADQFHRQSTCGGGPGAAPMTDPHKPMVDQNPEFKPMVFGRVPADVVSVSVVLADHRQTVRMGVIPGEGGPYYVVEIPKGAKPVMIEATRADGTTVQYPIP